MTGTGGCLFCLPSPFPEFALVQQNKELNHDFYWGFGGSFVSSVEPIVLYLCKFWFTSWMDADGCGLGDSTNVL